MLLLKTKLPKLYWKIYNTNFTNTGSVKQYFSDMSESEFKPQFDVKGVVKVSKNYAYYGQDLSENNRDIKYKEMIKKHVSWQSHSLELTSLNMMPITMVM